MSTTESVRGQHRAINERDWANLPRVTDHAELRWLERSGDTSVTVTNAWIEAYHVGGVSRGGTSRLHPPTGTILVEAQGVIQTVLNADFEDYNADHLVWCQTCRLEFQPLADDKNCPWCAATAPEAQ